VTVHEDTLCRCSEVEAVSGAIRPKRRPLAVANLDRTARLAHVLQHLRDRRALVGAERGRRSPAAQAGVGSSRAACLRTILGFLAILGSRVDAQSFMLGPELPMPEPPALHGGTRAVANRAVGRCRSSCRPTGVATCFSHPAVPLAIACWFPSVRRTPLLIAGSILSAAPDLDALGFFAGVPYEAWCGHRGCTHSIGFALAVAMLLTPWLARRTGVPKARVGAFLFMAWASHGIVDMATNGGLGIALLWPFTEERWFWPAQPIEVAPLGISAFFSRWGLEVLASEALWLWLPAILLGALGLWLRRPTPALATARRGPGKGRRPDRGGEETSGRTLRGGGAGRSVDVVAGDEDRAAVFRVVRDAACSSYAPNRPPAAARQSAGARRFANVALARHGGRPRDTDKATGLAARASHMHPGFRRCS